ncbi:hypothetical protein [Kamptonema formosum]|uniref:hypothetical protein n=1 Tax=Kamptonema formosum TaxID=331992 RepID=UPI000345670F|nr:hypothetical protein [Oscillatoria sp. PCC 10802]
MERLKSFLPAVGLVALGTACLASAAPPACAQAAYGSYVGVGGGFGVISRDGERQSSALIAIRYKVLEVPISLRAQAFLMGEGVALVPTVSYDIPLNWQTDTYVGAGVSFAGGETPVGNKTGFAIQPGIDYSLPNSRLVVFGNAIIAFDAYREQGGTAFSLQGGVGLRF